jgi:hypothetical protein
MESIDLPKILLIHRDTSSPKPLIDAIHALTSSDSFNPDTLIWYLDNLFRYIYIGKSTLSTMKPL